MNIQIPGPPAGEKTRARLNVSIVERLYEIDGGDTVTDADRLLFSQWCGWGPMAKALDPRVRDEPWLTMFATLRSLLPAEDFKQAQRACTTSYYTSADVIGAVWDLATRAGITGGKVLEPGCGHGRFLLGAPEGFTFTGVELDATSARIAKVLHGDDAIINGALEQTALRPASFQLAVGNVPFASVGVHDKARPDHGYSLHNYFIARALEAVEPGGLVALVTSRFTLDAVSDSQRHDLARLGQLVGAIRLPENAFADFGTSVIADLVVFRRHTDETRTGDESWIRTGYRHGCEINQYFVDHPEMILGTLSSGRGMYGRDELTVTADGDLTVKLAGAVDKIVATALATAPTEAYSAPENSLLADADGHKAGSYHLTGGSTVAQVDEGRMVPVRGGKELIALIGLRDAVLDLLALEADYDLADSALDAKRHELNRTYDRYVGDFGPINRCTIVAGKVDPETGLATMSRRRPVMGGFRRDPDFVTVLAIEDYDDESGVARKGPIFHGRINRRPDFVTGVGTIGEAIAVSLDRHGRIDVDTIGTLLDSPVDRTLSLLSQIAFEDPDTETWVPADEYLSGNVRAKLIAAKAAVVGDPSRYHRNVSELARVHPEDLRPEEIKVRPGAPWLETSVIEDFILELFGTRTPVRHDTLTATWEFEVNSWERGRAAAVATWGSSRKDGYSLLEMACNNATPIVYDDLGDGVKVRNVEETMLAIEKQRQISARFSEWVWEDPDRSDTLAARFNVLFNSTVVRRFDGSHLSFPGIRAGFKAYPHQLDQVYRSIATPAAACGHPVGAGKTSVMAMTALKLRELGLARKPAIVVPNHLLEQVSREIKALFPLARILMAAKEDMTKERRRLFAAKVATGDWDAVVLSHSAFTSIPVGNDLERRWLGEQIASYEASLYADQGGKRTMKRVQAALDKLGVRLQDLLAHRTDDGVVWEQLGIDYLLVDEAHYFKNLGFPTRVQGLSISASKRAQDLSVKLWHLRDRSAGARWATLLSGTLISNTLAEMFVLQSYLQPDRLAELGIAHFDAWADTFIENETRIEVSPDGKSFRMHTRPSKFSNVPELRRIFGEVADIRTKADLGLDGPLVLPDTVVIDPSPEMEAFVDTLVERAEKLRSGGGGGGTIMRADGREIEDNMLVVCTDGRKAALDLDLVGVWSNDGGKARPVVERALSIWKNSADLEYLDAMGNPSPNKGGFQLMFCDLGTPNADKGSQVYGKIREGLVAGGMPANRIRFIHDANSDAAKASLFSECRAGAVSVLMGSTDKLGVGTNVQSRMVAIHHVDAPWRPSDVDQRDGRGDRPGNQNATLDVIKYIRRSSFDAYMWQTLERKARFIAQVLTGELTAREVEDIGETVLTYTEIKALATGNPKLMEAAEAAADVVRLRQLLSGHVRGQRRIERDTAAQRISADNTEAVAATFATVIERSTKAGLIDIGDDVEVTERAEIGETIAYRVLMAMDRERANGAQMHRIGTYRGIPLQVKVQRAFKHTNLSLHTVGQRLDVRVCSLHDTWLKQGQFHRIASALVDAFDDMPAEVDARLMEATKTRLLAETGSKELGPFRQAAELAEAEQRVAEIEELIAAEVQPAA